MASTPETSEESWLQEAASLERPAETVALNPGDALLRGRFVIRRELGRGGMGVVYEAFDHARGQLVALKSLLRLQPGRLLRLKNEFRALLDVHHPNLVQLHGLHHDAGCWFVTMERVDGVTLDVALERAAPAELKTLFAQLARGVAALHAQGRLHRDLKPPNAMVEATGRLVIVDFGLVSELSPESAEPVAADERFCGTPAYMAPEQLACAPVGPPADWYAFGLMLHEALFGMSWSRGPSSSTAAPLQREPRPLTKVANLCFELLNDLPEHRPSAARILATFDAAGDRAALAPRERVFVGRARELSALSSAFERVLQKEAHTLLIRGESGMGKTSLMETFVRKARILAPSLVVLKGRCFPRETLPYNALDSIVDDLTQYLRGLSAAHVRRLLPEGTSALTCMFPVLSRVRGMEAREGSVELPRSPPELRRAAIRALRQLLKRVAREIPLLVWLDDLQWGDADSALLLHRLFAGEGPPALLCVASARKAPPGPCVEALESAGARVLSLGALEEADAFSLARRWLPAEQPAKLSEIAREAAGSPFFLGELCLQTRSAGNAPHDTSLEGAVLRRLALLPAPAQDLARAVALAARPLPPQLYLDASTAAEADYSAVDLLQRARLIALRALGDHEVLEPYHDRIREALRRDLPEPERSSLHARLADLFEAHAPDDDDAIIEHCLGCGQLRRATERCHHAAARAMRGMSFDRARSLYELALRLDAPTGVARGELLVALGDARAYAGVSGPAAEAFAEAANLLPTERLSLRCRAAHQWLIGGHLERGVPLLHEALGQLGIELPSTPVRALGSLLVEQARLRMRALDRAPSSACSAADAQRLEALGLATMGLSMFDNVRAAALGARFLVEALDRGEAAHIAAGLTANAALLGALGTRQAPRVSRLLGRARELSADILDPPLRGFQATAMGIAATSEGAWRRGRDLCLLALQYLRADGARSAWEASTAQVFLALARFYLGEIALLCREVPARIEEARERGNRYLEATLTCSPATFAWLALDQVETAQAELSQAPQFWPKESYLLQHAMLCLSQAQLASYRGDPGAAAAMVRADLPALSRAQLLRISLIGVNVWVVLAAGAIHDLRCGRGSGRSKKREARAAIRRVARAPMRAAPALSGMLRAALAQAENQPKAALGHLTCAASLSEQLDMPLYAAAARRAHGLLTGGPRGEAQVAQAEARFRAEGVRDVGRFALLLAPLDLP